MAKCQIKATYIFLYVQECILMIKKETLKCIEHWYIYNRSVRNILTLYGLALLQFQIRRTLYFDNDLYGP